MTMFDFQRLTELEKGLSDLELARAAANRVAEQMVESRERTNCAVKFSKKRIQRVREE